MKFDQSIKFDFVQIEKFWRRVNDAVGSKLKFVDDKLPI